MGRDDLFRRTFEAGMSFLDMSRERAEALVKDLVKAGEVQKGKTQKAIDDLLERSRKGSEELRQLIRREINQQMSAMGVATHDDISRLEARLADLTAAPAATAPAPPPPEAPEAAAPAPSPAPVTDTPATDTPVTDAPPPPNDAPAKAAPIKRATPKKSAKKAATAKVPPLKKAGPARKKAAAPALPPPAGEE